MVLHLPQTVFDTYGTKHANHLNISNRCTCHIRNTILTIYSVCCFWKNSIPFRTGRNFFFLLDHPLDVAKPSITIQWMISEFQLLLLKHPMITPPPPPLSASFLSFGRNTEVVVKKKPPLPPPPLSGLKLGIRRFASATQNNLEF